jgi:glucuronate isomerase
MKPFLDADFLLPDDSSRRLFAAVADQPILDFHCHLPPADVARDAPLKTIAHAWLGGDAHKWRAMRLNGVPEADITGHEPDYRTFLAWARTVPKLVGSPLYHWTHLELQRCFGIQETLCERTAPAIWEACNAQLATPAFGARALLTRMQVRAVCTTDDPTDSLEHHVAYAAVRKPSEPVMVPGFRPDKAMAVEDPAVWNAYLDRLEAAASLSISSYRDLVTALDRRHAAFHAQGCRASDHALVAPPASFVTPEALGYQFANLRKGVVPSGKEAEAFRTALLLEVGRMDARRGWVMQLHLGAIRNLNTPMFQKLGPDSGFDGAADEKIGKKLAAFLDTLQREGLLPKMVLYSLNPNDYEVLTSIMGCFQEGALPGKCQLGSAWWFNHHIEGMRRQMTALANLGQLSRFVGMPTDSRSFLSFPRHEYFRRILCALVGGWIEAGEAPADFETFGAMVQDIAYRNARDYFALPGLED